MFRFFLSFFFMTPNLQTKGVKWGCKVIWGQRESLEVMKYPSFNSQLWPETIRTIPKEVFERIYIKRPQPGGQKYHKCRYSVQSIQGQGGEIVFHAGMQGLLMGRLWRGQMGDHASRVSLIKIWKKHTTAHSSLPWDCSLFILKPKHDFHQLSQSEKDANICSFWPSRREIR